jgi:acetyl esterase/lipase
VRDESDAMNQANALARLGVVTAIVLTAGLASGCRATTVINFLSPSAHYQQDAGQAYGDEPRQRLDVYWPAEVAPDAPVVLFFYGNGWREASRADFEFVASALTRAGVVVVIPAYRAYPQVSFPTFVEDGARAVQWVTENIAGVWRGERRLFLMGHSAGAQIAALLAFDASYLAGLADPPPRVAGFIGLSGPYDFLPLAPGYLEEVFPEDSRLLSQPIEFVSARSPPSLLIHGTADQRVLPQHSVRLAQKLESHEVPVTLKQYENTGHARVVAALAPPLRFIADTLDDCIAFILAEQARAYEESLASSDRGLQSEPHTAPQEKGHETLLVSAHPGLEDRVDARGGGAELRTGAD